MAKSFIDELDQDQQRVARDVYKAAVNAGVDPLFAVSVAFAESGLRPNVKRGSSGEIGLMQVMPETGKGLGFSEEDLMDPAKNIQAGIAYLKQALKETQNDPKLAAAYYNGGPGALQALISDKDPDPRVINYVKRLSALGAFEPQQPAEGGQKAQETPEQKGEQGAAPPAASPTDQKTEPPAETDEQRDARMRREQQEFADAAERRQAQILGAGAGASIAAIRGGKDIAGSVAENIGRRSEMGKQSVRRAATPPQAPAAVPPASVPPGPLAAPIEPTSAQATRILQGTTGDAGTTGRARMVGFNTETSQTAAAQKRAYELAAHLRDLGIVTDDAPTFLAKQPGLTSTPSGVLTFRGEPPTPTLGPRGPLGQVGASRPPYVPDLSEMLKDISTLDVYRPAEATAATAGQKLASGLEAVSKVFMTMMKPVSTAARYVAPPLTLASAAGEAANIAQQARRPEGSRDMTSIGLSGANILGGGLSLFPPTMAVGIPLSIATGATQAYRENPEFRNFVNTRILRRGPAESGGLPVVP